jgi:hypothetical protein
MAPPCIQNVNFKPMTFSAPFVNRNGGHSAFPNSGPASERGKVEFQMTAERAPFGVNRTDPNGNPVEKRYNLALSVEDENNRVGLEAFDSQVVKYFHTNAKTYWPKKKKLSLEDVERMYRPVLAPSSDPEKYSPLARLKIHKDPDNPNGNTKIFVVTKNAKGKDTYNDNGLIEDISRNSRVTVVVRATCAWMLGGGIQFGVTLKVLHALVYPSQTDEEEFPFTMPEGTTDGARDTTAESLTTGGLAAALTAAGVAIDGGGSSAPSQPSQPPLKKQRAVPATN